MLVTMIQGFCMALADSVPGVSGGTIAFIMGFYDRFIGSIEGAFFGNKKKRIDSCIYLVKLGTGWCVGMISSILLLASIFDSHIYAVSSVFIGFIIGAIPIIYMEEKASIHGKVKNLIFFLVGVGVVVGLTFFNAAGGAGIDISYNTLTVSLAAYVFVAGMAAISAMFLPGISGSTILFILGLYIPIITGIKAGLHGSFAAIPTLAIFAFGAIVGALTVVKAIKRCLESYRSQTIYLILGLMIGSIYAVAMGPTTLEVPKAAMTLANFDWLFFAVGVGIIAAIQLLKKLK